MNPRTYLEAIVPTREQVEQFLTRAGPDGLSPNRGWTYHAELGWVHADAVHEGDGREGTRTYYHYEDDGARGLGRNRDQPCRIHAYGNSFTHCDQVNDGETWEEYLGSFLQEPVRNYGVGGYSVYQAYRRMRVVERDGPHRASHIILNIWDDDHCRNIDSWRRLRFGRGTQCGFTLPHLRVDRSNDTFEERENLCPGPEDAYRLCDADWVYNTFRDDPVLAMVLNRRQEEGAAGIPLEPVPVSFGLRPNPLTDKTPDMDLRRAHLEDSLFATRCVLGLVEKFVEETGKKLMVMLSFGAYNLADPLKGEPRFDEAFAEWLKTRPYPVIDMRDAFAAGLADSKLDVEAYLDRYYIGHHTPAGNFFTAEAVRKAVVEWLDPAPRPYG